MEEEEYLSSEKGIYGKVFAVINYFRIYIEECEDFHLGNKNYGHVYLVYQLHDGCDFRTHMVTSLEGINECVEKMKKDILATSRDTQQTAEALYNYWSENNEFFSRFLDNVIGKNGKRFGGGFPVCMEKCDDGSYVVYELNATESILIRPCWYKTKKEANDGAQALAKHKVLVYEYERLWGFLKSARMHGIIIKEYPNDCYITALENGGYVAYQSDVYRRDNAFIPENIDDFEDLEAAEKYVNSILSED